MGIFMTHRIIVAGLACGLLAGAAHAQSIDSAYTRDLTCGETVEGGELAPYFTVCEGYGGWRVAYGSSEHTSRIAFGDRGLDRQFGQSPELSGLDLHAGEVIEWRVVRESGGWRPFATINRWTGSVPNYDENTGEFPGGSRVNSQVLVVTALREAGPVSACHVAYVDALTVSDHNAIARLVADHETPGFDCETGGVLLVDADDAAGLRAQYGD